MPVRLIEILSALSAIMSIGLVAAAWLGGGRADTRPRTFAAVIIAGFVFNVAICGALSTPHDRYSTRILWIVPIAAAAVGSSLLIRRNPSVLETSHVYK
jgi:small basic protein